MNLIPDEALLFYIAQTQEILVSISVRLDDKKFVFELNDDELQEDDSFFEFYEYILQEIHISKNDAKNNILECTKTVRKRLEAIKNGILVKVQQMCIVSYLPPYSADV